jgi:hypothetical protein
MSASGPWLLWSGMFLLALCLFLVSQFFFGALAAALAVAGVLLSYAFWFLPRSRQPGNDRGFVTEEAPRGIVSLELAGSFRQAIKIVQSWQRRSLETKPPRHVLAEVTTAIGKDFGFILGYMLVFLCATVWTVDVLQDRDWGPSWLADARVAATIGLLVVAAGIADIVENLLVLRMIAGAMRTDRVPAWTRVLAMTKFVVLAVAAAYASLGLVAAV